MSKGTPKTLNEAILNALNESNYQGGKVLAKMIEDHVRDFLAQRFGVHTMSNNEDVSKVVNTLWQQVTKVS